MTRAAIVVVVVAVAVVAGVLLFSSAVRRGFSAHDEPTMMEAMSADNKAATAAELKTGSRVVAKIGTDGKTALRVTMAAK